MQWKSKGPRFRSVRLINTRLSLFLFLFLPQILLPMRLLIPFAARPVNSNGRPEKINGIRCVSSADTKRDVPGRGQWLSKGTTYKYHLVRDLSSSLRRRLLLLLPSLACGVYLDNLPLGGSGIRYGQGSLFFAVAFTKVASCSSFVHQRSSPLPPPSPRPPTPPALLVAAV